MDGAKMSEAIAKLMTGTNEDKVKAAEELRDLADSNAANQATIAELGGLEALVELVREGISEQKHWAAAALRKLANGSTVNQARIKVAIANARFEVMTVSDMKLWLECIGQRKTGNKLELKMRLTADCLQVNALLHRS